MRSFSKTGHWTVADLMRYAAMDQTLDVLGNYGGFIPAARDGRTLAPPGTGEFNGAATASGCARCHLPLLDTANQLVPAPRFTPPADHLAKYDILNEPASRDQECVLKTVLLDC